MLLIFVKHTDDFFFGATSAGVAADATKKWILSQYFIPYLARRESMAWKLLIAYFTVEQLFTSFAMRVFFFEGLACFRNATAFTHMTIAAPQDCRCQYAVKLFAGF